MLGHSAESSPEELLDVFKAAALSVTKLYKTSAAVQSKARIEGYQDCLEDLLAVLDKGDVDVRTIRRWIVERLDGREPILPTIESEDEVEKTDGGSTPEPQSAAAGNGDRQARGAEGSRRNSGGNNTNAVTSTHSDTVMHTGAEAEAEAEMETETETPSPIKNRKGTTSTMGAPTPSTTKKTAKSKARGVAAATTTATSSTTATAGDTAPEHAEPADMPTPTSDHFTFRSTVPYPTESFLELANLDLSDRRSASGSVKDASEPPAAATSAYVFNASSAAPTDTSSSPSHTTGSRQFRVRHTTGRSTGRNTLSARHNRSSAGQKRKLNFDEIFDVASLGYGKDVFGRGGGKRSRQA